MLRLGYGLKLMQTCGLRIEPYFAMGVHGQIVEYAAVIDSVGIGGEHLLLHVVGKQKHHPVTLFAWQQPV